MKHISQMNEYEINVLYLKYGKRLAPDDKPSPLDTPTDDNSSPSHPQ